MAIPLYAIRSTITGSLPGGDIFECSQWFDGTAIGNDFTKFQAFAGVVVGSITGNLLTTAVKALYNVGVTFDKLDCYGYPNGGPHAGLHWQVAIGAAGSSSTLALPNQVATVVTLLTGRPGRSYRGRTYLPPVHTAAMLGTNQLSTANATTLANAYAGYLQGVHDSSSGAPAVVSSSKLGAMTLINAVQVDTVFDTQRRRRNKVVAAGKPQAAVSQT